MIEKANLTWNNVFELPIIEFLLIVNYIIDENEENKKQYKLLQR